MAKSLQKEKIIGKRVMRKICSEWAKGAENEEKLKSLLMKVKEESKKLA